jgi:predicted amidohydrolase YtcJ
MQQLHLGWLAQNALYFQAKSFSEMYGLDSLKNSPNFKYAIEQRIPMGFGTDAHRVMGFNPFDAIEWLVTGKSVDGHEGQRIISAIGSIYRYRFIHEG